MKWRRRQYIIDQKFQWRFVRRLIIPLVLGVVIITLVDYYFIWSFFTSPTPARYENMEFISLKIVGYLLFYELCIFIPIVVIIGLIISHRVAGPLFQIERILRSIGDGDLSRRIILREKDELKNLAMCINEMTTGLSNKISELEDDIKFLEEKLSFLENEAGKELPNINKIRDDLKALYSSFNTFKDSLSKFKK